MKPILAQDSSHCLKVVVFLASSLTEKFGFHLGALHRRLCGLGGLTDMNKGNEKLGWMQSLKAVQDLPPGVWEGLVRAGFGDPRLFVVLGDDTDEELETLYAGLGDKALEPEEISSGVILLRKAIEQAKVIATQSHKQSWSLTEIERAGVIEERNGS